MVDAVRHGALQITTFGVGLVLLAIGPVLVGIGCAVLAIDLARGSRTDLPVRLWTGDSRLG